MKRKILLGLVTIILCLSMVGMPNPGKAMLAAPNQPDTACGTDPALKGCWLLDESSGLTTADGSVNGNTGNLLPVSSPPLWVAGKYGNGLQFALVNSQYVQVPNNSTIDIRGSITLATWVKVGAIGTQHLIQRGRATAGTPTDGGYEISLASTGTVFFRLNYGLSHSNTYRIDTVTTYPIDNTWFFVAGVYDSSVPSIDIYFNGLKDELISKSGPASILAMDTDLNLGRDPGGGQYLNGTMDEARIWNRALSADEIYALYTGPTAVNLVNFKATSIPHAIRLDWQTGQEINLLGFNLYRAEALDGPQVQINPQLIPAINPGQFQGNNYKYLDATADVGRTYYYWVEWVGKSSSERYGPVTANIAAYWLWLPIGLK